jgi:hypothetical protein
LTGKLFSSNSFEEKMFEKLSYKNVLLQRSKMEKYVWRGESVLQQLCWLAFLFKDNVMHHQHTVYFIPFKMIDLLRRKWTSYSSKKRA